MNIIIVRHGQTDANIAKVVQTAQDTGLNDTGIKQVNALGEHLISLNLVSDLIYSSNLNRAKQTAQILSHYLKAPVEIEPLLREISFGSLEGASKDVFVEVEFGYHSEKMAEASGETVQQVAERIKSFLKKLVASPHKNIMCVGHGLALSVFTNILLNEESSFANFHAHMNADFSQFEVELQIIDGDLAIDLLKYKLYGLYDKPAF